MAGANTALRIAELDFVSIRNNLKTFLQSQSEFTDYDFEGAGLSVLLDILSYNTHYMGYYLNMIGSEMFLDTAQIRGSVLSHAKHINYTPSSAKGAVAYVNVTVTPPDGNTTTTLTIPKYTRFVSQTMDTGTYVFNTTDSYTAIKANGAFSYSNVEIRQGEVVTQRFPVTAGVKRFTIPSANVDLDTLTVSVQKSSGDTSTNSWIVEDDLTNVGPSSNVFFVEESSELVDGTYTIYFGDGSLGRSLSNGNIIIATYLDTAGEYANKANAFTTTAQILGTSTVAVTPISAAQGGSPKETIEQIRFHAPYAYTTQNRAVTSNDFKTLILKDYPSIQSVAVWPGDENDPPIYGKVFLSLKPKENYVISTLEKQRIVNEVIANRSILTVTPEIIDPDYEYVLVDAKVNYDPAVTNISEAQLKTVIRQAILDYANQELNEFDSVFIDSNLQRYIDKSHPAIVGSYLDTTTQKRLTATTNQIRAYTADFGHRLHRGSIDDRFNIYPALGVYDTQGIYREIYIEDTPNSLTGVNSIQIINPGNGYTSAPTITITGDGVGATAEATVVGGQINKITVINRGSDYTIAYVTITGGGGTGGVAQITIQSRIGTLRSFYYSTTGEKIILNPSIGTIDYIAGIVTLTPITISNVPTNDRYDGDIITFNADPYEGIILPARNKILTIDENDPTSIQITLIPKTT